MCDGQEYEKSINEVNHPLQVKVKIGIFKNFIK